MSTLCFWKGASAHYCCLWPGKQRVLQGWGKGDLHRAVIAGITELQKPSGENLSLLKILWCFISLVCSTRWSCLCILYMKCDTLAQAGHQSSCSPDFTVHRQELCAASPPSESRLQWEESGAFLWQPVLPALPAVFREAGWGMSSCFSVIYCWILEGTGDKGVRGNIGMSWGAGELKWSLVALM